MKDLTKKHSKSLVTLDSSYRHGESRTKLHNIWWSIITRCEVPSDSNYVRYGARGITVCMLWRNSYEAFRDWSLANGYKENAGLSIDRIDTYGPYAPENCRWTTRTIQSRNKRIYSNNTTGVNGVSWNIKQQKFQVRISVNNKLIFLGSFDTLEEAIAVRIAGENTYW